ncbi:hypothetical protein MRX96_041621 [Rhipicephalus microplus]
MFIDLPPGALSSQHIMCHFGQKIAWWASSRQFLGSWGPHSYAELDVTVMRGSIQVTELVLSRKFVCLQKNRVQLHWLLKNLLAFNLRNQPIPSLAPV